jgi:[FeFe] hydrogenase H-cluster maturation GTPase HydF
MGLNSTPSSERINIAFFGKTNSGKSSLINAITNQNIAIVSDIAGTTTDPVYKSMEILPLGPVNLIDTAGFDDESSLGKLRIEKTNSVLNKTDIAILVTDAQTPLDEKEKQFIQNLNDKNIKYIIVYNKSDLTDIPESKEYNEIYVSALKNINIEELKDLISSFNGIKQDKRLISDKISPNDKVILVTPIDSAAPKGRIILPQQQVLRDLLDSSAVTVVVKETELKEALRTINNPKLVITDSQAFKKVSAETPENILLTSFSILFARYKGVLETAVKGVKSLEAINDNDTILISEGCTHHRQCDDIGTVKLPNWIKTYTGKNINFEFTSGTGFPDDLSKYKMIIHCGACMLKEQEVIYRYNQAIKQNIPISNYGITIAYINGILKRSIQIFPEIYNIL